jgi:tectonin beta-propeller repeat-containing protein 1
MLLDNYKGTYLQIDEVEIYTYENQRWNVLTGFSTIGKAFLFFFVKSKPQLFTKKNIISGFPTDRYTWSDETGKERRRKEECSLPTSQFQWSTDWQIDFSTPCGVDNDGWQYAIDFPRNYHAIKTSLDFVRRRRWCRKCKTRIHSYWIEIFQTLKITSIALDIESDRSLLQENTILLWATETDGNALCALINKSTPAVCKWQYVSSEITFKNITIGNSLKVYAVSTTGNIFYRYGVNHGSYFCGTSWSVLESPNLEGLKFKQISAGSCTLWAISEDDTLYFRENITNTYPEGTSWAKVSDFIQFVTVNLDNEVGLRFFKFSSKKLNVLYFKVYAIESSSNRGKDSGSVVLYREGVDDKNVMGSSWKALISVFEKFFSFYFICFYNRNLFQIDPKMVSNRGIFK